MGLKFLEPDARVPYIREEYERFLKLGIGVESDLYKKGKRPALLIVDFQKGFVSSDSPIVASASQEEKNRINSTIEKTRVLLDMVRKKGFPVLYTVCAGNHHGDLAGFGPIAERSPLLFQATEPGPMTEVDDRIAPQEDDHVIAKLQTTGFVDTNIQIILTYNRVDTCIVAGAYTSACVRANAIDLISRGFYAVVVEECVHDTSEPAAKASLLDLVTRYCDVASFDDVMSYIKSFPDVDRKKNPPYRR